jgi:hypothetical protein
LYIDRLIHRLLPLPKLISACLTFRFRNMYVNCWSSVMTQAWLIILPEVQFVLLGDICKSKINNNFIKLKIYALRIFRFWIMINDVSCSYYGKQNSLHVEDIRATHGQSQFVKIILVVFFIVSNFTITRKYEKLIYYMLMHGSEIFQVLVFNDATPFDVYSCNLPFIL